MPPNLLQTVSPIPSNATVKCLLDEDLGSWNEETVRAFFQEDIANEILMLPVGQHGEEDYVRWPHTRFGEYSVRSAYNLARSARFQSVHSASGRGMTSDGGAAEKCWKSIWSIKAPNKMKVVLWRLAHDCLPSGVQLHRRHVPTSDLCCFCGRTESIEHSLLFCPFAYEVWSHVKQSFDIKLWRSQFSSPRQWLFDFLTHSSDLMATVMAVTIWHVWEARSSTRNNEDEPHPVRTAFKIKAYVDLIVQHLYKLDPAHRRESTASSSVWSPPPPGTLLFMSDAAIFSELGKIGAGVVALNADGQCVVACREATIGRPIPEMAEALALRRAVYLARGQGCESVIFASDCLSLVQRVNSPIRDRSLVGSVVSDSNLALQDSLL